MISKVNLEGKIKEIPKKPWFSVEVARVNGYVLRMACFTENTAGTNTKIKMKSSMYTKEVY
jgi:hypothetical protein